MAAEGIKRAVTLEKVLQDHTKMIGTILVGNNIANIGASSLATALSLHFFKNVSVSVTAGILTLVVLIWGEILPKSMATIHANKIALLYAPIIRLLMIILTPVVFLINKVSLVLMKVLQLDKTKDSVITEQELKAIIEVGHREGVLESEEKEFINNILAFTDASADEVMTPRIDMIFIHEADDYERVAEIFQSFKFTRYPVYNETKDEVTGVLNMKDLLLITDRTNFSVRDYMRPAYFTYESKAVGDLMPEMRRTGHNIVIVLDEYGLTAGLVTLEDLLEELVGDIRDEFDAEEPDEICDNGDGTFTVDAMCKLDDLNRRFHLNLSGDGYDNLAGFISETLNHIPKPGESIVVSGYRFKVIDIKNKRLIRVMMIPEP